MKRMTSRKRQYMNKGGKCPCSQNIPSLLSKGGNAGGFINPASFSDSKSIPHYPYNTQYNSPLSPHNITPARLTGGKRKKRSSSRNRKRSARRSFKKRNTRGGSGGLFNQLSSYYTSTAGTSDKQMIQDPTNHKYANIQNK
jgi:hypothetical protein